MEIKVTFMSGAGNLFTVIDNRRYGFSVDFLKKAASFLCNENKQHVNNTEGLIAINPGDEKLAFRAEFFNPDGSHGAMCGNGGRCALAFAKVKGFLNDSYKSIKFYMANEIYSGEFVDNTPRLYLPPPLKIENNITIDSEKNNIPAAYVDVNSDHVVINKNKVEEFVELPIRQIDLNEFARPIRYHKDFEPKGVNVNLYEVSGANELTLRTYERGVEAETGACGTGSVSTAIIAVLNKEAFFPITIIPPSGIELIVDSIGSFPEKIQSIALQGHAAITGEIQVNYKID